MAPPTTIAKSEPPFTNDKESITADPVDECSVYVTWTRFNSFAADSVLLSQTSDCGATWSEPKAVHVSSPAGFAAQLIVLPDGTLLDFFKELDFTLEERSIYVKRSTDAGESRPLPPTLVATLRVGPPVTPDGGELIRSGFFDVAVDRKSGLLAAVWEAFIDGALPVNVAFSSSSDGGATWSMPIRIDQTPRSTSVELEQAFLPSVEVSGDGTIGVTYYNFENDAPGDTRADTDHWFIHCHPEVADCNRPESWSEGLRLTTESFDYRNAASVSSTSNSGLFLGDYVGLASSGSDFFAFFSVTTATDPANAIFVPIYRR